MCSSNTTAPNSSSRRMSVKDVTTSGLCHLDKSVVQEMAYVPPYSEGDGVADTAEGMWARMIEGNPSQAYANELEVIRENRIAVEKQLADYREREKQLLKTWLN